MNVPGSDAAKPDSADEANVTFVPPSPWERIPPNELGLSGWALRKRTGRTNAPTTICAVLGSGDWWQVHAIGVDGLPVESLELDELAQVISRAEGLVRDLGWAESVFARHV